MPHPLPSSEEHERVVGWLFAAVLAAAFATRLWLALSLPPYFDDRYVINNLLNALDGSLRPKHVFYGSLSFLPQTLVLAVSEWLHSLTGIEALAVRGPQVEGLTLGAFRIARMVVVTYGLLSLVMAYLVGRRLFSPTVGLVAAAVLASYSRHVKSSIQLKPDMLAMLFTLVALYWAAGAARDPRLARFLRAGVGVGLATSAKYTGAASALPITAWALWTGWRDRRRWGRLVLAGFAAVATFFALNPFIGMVFHYVPRLVHGYAAHAKRDRSDNLRVLIGEIKFVASEHGFLFGALLLVGTALLIRQLRRRRSDDWQWAAAVLPLSLFIGYPLIHAAGMTLFRRQNLMPAMAAAALVCAYGTVRSWEWLRSRAPGGRRWAPAAVLLLGGLLLARPFGYAYEQIVPDTWQVASRTLRSKLAPLRARHIAFEPKSAVLHVADNWQRAATTEVPSLAALPPAALDVTDAEVFPLSRLKDPEAAFYQERRRAAARENLLEIRPRLFHSRGAPLLLLLHPWTLAGDSISLNAERSAGSPRLLTARLPAHLSAGDVLSIELIRPSKERATSAVLLRPGGRRIAFQYAGRRRHQVRLLTPRFELPAGVAGIQVRASALANPKSFRLRVWRWTRAPRPPEG